MLKNRRLSLLLLFIFASVIAGIIMMPYISYTTEPLILFPGNQNVRIETRGFYLDDGIYYSSGSKSTLDIYFDDYYSEVVLLMSIPPKAVVNSRLYYSAHDKYSEYVNTSAYLAVNNEEKNMKFSLPEAVNGKGYMHLEFSSDGISQYKISRIEVGRREYKITSVLILRALFVGVIAVCLYLLYEFGLFELKGSKINTYLYVLLCCTSMFYLFSFLTMGGTYSTVLSSDLTDTFMDYFNCIADALEGNPYDKYSNYPPFALLIIKGFSYVVSGSYKGEKVTGRELRGLQPMLMGYYLVVLFVLFILIRSFNSTIKNRNAQKVSTLFLLLSAPVVFAIERGNIVLIAFAFLMIFAKYYDSENKVIREIALISLVIAFAIKLYPAIFGVLLLRKKKWKEALRAVLYGVIFFLVPFSYYGFSYGISQFWQGIFLNAEFEYGTGQNVSLYNILRTFSAVFGIELSMDFYHVVFIAVVLVLLVSAFAAKKDHVAVVAMCLLALLVPKFNYFYAVILIFVPFLQFIKDFETYENTVYCKIWMVLYACMLVPWAFPVINSLSSGYKIYTSWGNIIEYLALIAMVVYCGYELVAQTKNRDLSITK